MEFNELKEYYANLIRESLLGEATEKRYERVLKSKGIMSDASNAAFKRDQARIYRIGKKAYEGGINFDNLNNIPERKRDKILMGLAKRYMLSQKYDTQKDKPFFHTLGNVMRDVTRSQYM